MIHQVPPAPVSALPIRPAPPVARAAKPAAEPLDARFLRRCLGWTPLLGLCFALALWGATRSAGAAGSLLLGSLCGGALLWSEMALIGRVLTAAAEAKRAKSSGKKMLLGALWVLKWVPVGVALYLLTHCAWFVALPFALGCTVFQVVVFAKVLGRTLVSR